MPSNRDRQTSQRSMLAEGLALREATARADERAMMGVETTVPMKLKWPCEHGILPPLQCHKCDEAADAQRRTTVPSDRPCIICGKVQHQHMKIDGIGYVCPISGSTYRTDYAPDREAPTRAKVEAEIVAWLQWLQHDRTSDGDDDGAVILQVLINGAKNNEHRDHHTSGESRP